MKHSLSDIAGRLEGPLLPRSSSVSEEPLDPIKLTLSTTFCRPESLQTPLMPSEKAEPLSLYGDKASGAKVHWRIKVSIDQ